MIRIRDISLAPGAGIPQLQQAAAKLLKCSLKDILSITVVKQSVDARKKNDVRIIWTVDCAVRGDEAKRAAQAKNPKITIPEYRPYRIPVCSCSGSERPVIAGFGPAGMFAALLLAEAGLKPIVLERGYDADRRAEAVERFWSTGVLDPVSNVQFGEGGAGMFSDGKLNTGVNDYRNRFVLEQLVRFGGEERLLTDAKPHVGTDVLREVVKRLRTHVEELGGEVRFEAKLTGILQKEGAVSGARYLQCGTEHTVETRHLLLAVGHSARDTFRMLEEAGLPMEAKPFSMGVRIEHLQKKVDEAQYGGFAGNPFLPAADYKLNVKLPDGGSAYTFCMCPGGYVVAAASEEGRVATNGMSYSGRDGRNANSALLVTLHPEDFPYPGVLGGVRWQEELEERAFRAGGGNYRAPAQRSGDFLARRPSEGAGSVEPTYRPGVTWCDLHEVLPEKLTKVLEQAIPALDRCLRGFGDPDAVLTAPETRSSSPVRLLRDDSCSCTGLRGLYPCGEGAGYAGGIMSAAVDGLRCAEAIAADMD